MDARNDLPPDLEAEALLSEGERSVVLRVRRGGERFVLRIGRHEADLAPERAVAARVEGKGWALPVEAGRTPGGRPYLLRPFVEGEPFDRAARAAGPDALVRWTRELLEALARLHAAGLVHRDLSASNVIVGADGPVLVDLDLAGRADAREPTGGTVFHVAPEVLAGHPARPASDLFSLGAMLHLAVGGPPDPRFHERFPARPFPEASGIPTATLPEPLRPLAAALVRRHPADRPEDAAAALALLPGGVAPPPPRVPPARLGAEDALAAACAALSEGRGATIETVDPEDADAAVREVALALALEGVPAHGGPLAALRPSEGEGPIAAAVDAGTEPLEVARTIAATLERARPLALAGTAEALDAALATEAGSLFRVGATAVRWPRLGEDALAGHLDRLSGGAAPREARALARSLLARTGGRRGAVARALERAVEDGVLRPVEGAYALLTETWPEQAEDGRGEARVWPELSPAARALLSAAAVLGADHLDARTEALAELPAGALEAARLELVRNGALDAADGRIGFGWLAAAREAPDEAALGRMRDRAGSLIDDPVLGEAVRARLALALARNDGDLDAVLDAVERLTGAGRLGAARELARAARARATADATIERAIVLEARLDLAQSRAEDALRRLTAWAGEKVEDASDDVALAAADALEQIGRRDRARAVFEHVFARASGGEARLRAAIGLGYGALLDGDAEGALARTEEVAGIGDPPRLAGTLANLRGGAFARLARYDEAVVEFERAGELGRRSGDPTLLGRAAINRAFVWRRRGRSADALRAAEDALEAFRAAGHVKLVALAANNLGTLLADRGETRAATASFETALALRRRIGDAHGASSTEGSLAITQAEGGRLGAALELGGRAHAALAEGGYGAEEGLLALHLACAAALAGDLEGARRWGASEAARGVARERVALAARGEALIAWAEGREDRALEIVRRAVREGPEGEDGDLAERFRLLAIWCALAPESEEARRRLAACAERIDAPVRRAEARWLARATGDVPGVEELAGWLETFEGAGRTDLVQAVADELAAALDARGDVAGRRRALARRDAAREALVAGLPAARAEAALARLSLLAGARDARTRRLDLDWFLACNRRLAAEEDLEALLQAIVHMALEVTGARRGFLVLVEDGEVVVEVAHGMDRQPMSAAEARFSRTLVFRAIESGETVLTHDAARDERFLAAESISRFELRSVLCVPLPRVAGALYVDDDQVGAAFDAVDAERIGALADQAAVAIGQLRRRREIEELNRRLAERVDTQEKELVQVRRALRKSGRTAPVGALTGDSEPMQRLYRAIEMLAPSELSVLITGPSGSGKDLVARAVHQKSGRASKPFIAENVAAIPAELLESELFGHVRGAFTGATRDRMGLFAEAEGGTFLLDEIGELPLSLQAKLLRVLETGEYRPVGSTRSHRADVRVLAATHRDLEELVHEGRFRRDLYYRLNAAELRVPSLAERVEDVPLLVERFLADLAAEHGVTKGIDEQVLAALMRRPWPGEVRELKNEIARLWFLSGERIDDPTLVRTPEEGSDQGPRAPTSLRLEDLERWALQRALEATGGRKDRAAKLLGISRTGLYAKLGRLGLR